MFLTNLKFYFTGNDDIEVEKTDNEIEVELPPAESVKDNTTGTLKALIKFCNAPQSDCPIAGQSDNCELLL